MLYGSSHDWRPERDWTTASAGRCRRRAGTRGIIRAYRDRLRQMVRLRLDRRLQGRIDPSDVLQEVYLDFAKRLPEYAADPSMAFYLQ